MNFSTNSFLGSLAISAAALGGCAQIVGIHDWTDAESSSGSGMGGQGGIGAGGSVGTPPVPVHPSAAGVLTPTRAHFFWNDGTIPSGLSVDSYQFCWTSGPMTDIADDSLCPNPSNPKISRQAVDSLAKNSTYFWKVRTTFNDLSQSAFTGVQTFTTDDSVVALLKFDEGSGTSTADSSGKGNNGTLQNTPTWTAGFLGKALKFGGTSYVSVPNSASLNFGSGDFTFSARIKTNASGIRQAILEKVDSGNGYYFYALATGALGFFGGSCGIAISGGNVTDGMWHHVIVSRSGTKVSLSVDAAPVGNATCADNFSNTSVLAVGCNSPSLGCVDPFNGIIDDVQLYKRAITADDVANDDCAALVLSGATTFPAFCN